MGSPTRSKTSPIGHRPPLKVGTVGRERLITLAPGTVRPTGWVRAVAELECTGHLAMVVREDPNNFRTSFYDGSPTIHGGEHAGYWNDAFIGLALLTGDEERLSEAGERIEATLAAAESRERFLSEHYNGWGAHLMIQALLTWFEANRDERVLELCHRVALELLDDLNDPLGRAFDGDHPVNMATSCARLYGYTGDERMLKMGETIMARFDAGGLPNLVRLWKDDRLGGHGVNYCEDIRHPAEFYLFSGNPRHLAASERGVELTVRDHLQIQGAPTGNEIVYGKGPLKETEHCDTVEWSFVGHALLAATGEARYADLAEKALFNAWAGSRKWDGRSLSYNHSPNQITASSWEGTWPPRMCLSPYHEPQCCNLNTHRALHPYAFRMWMLNADGGLAAVYYGDCELKAELPRAGVVEIIEKTGYPFDEEVSITVNPEIPATFRISLRIPRWCREATVSLNGEPLPGSPDAGSFFRITREWNRGDRIDLRLPMPISLEWCEVFEEPAARDPNHADFDSSITTQIGLRAVSQPAPGRHLVAVSRGPLVYALHIEPKRIVEPDERKTEGFVVESVVPKPDAAPWNVALVLDREHPEESFEFVRLKVPDGSAPLEHTPAGLRCKARVVPNWKPAGSPDRPVTTLPPLPVEARGDEVEALLVPFGCTSIRLTWLPFVFG